MIKGASFVLLLLLFVRVVVEPAFAPRTDCPVRTCVRWVTVTYKRPVMLPSGSVIFVDSERRECVEWTVADPQPSGCAGAMHDPEKPR